MLPNISSTLLAASTTAEIFSDQLTFGLVDYIVFVLMLVVFAGMGVYFGFASKSKNTTEEYLMGGRNMSIIPIAISLVAR